MFQFEYNAVLDADTLTDLFRRAGWSESDPECKVEWAMAASEDWVTCSVEGELVGFGRTYQLDVTRKLVFDVVVDRRYSGQGVDEEIVRLLAAGTDGLQELAVFRHEDGQSVHTEPVPDGGVEYPAPDARPDAYLG